jgi:mono/diheme cytochrome c family protein
MLALIGMLSVLLIACGPRQARIVVRGVSHQKEQIARGGGLFQQHCSVCHGASGEGQFPDAPLEPDSTGRYGAPPHNTTGHTWHHSDEQLFRYVRDGGFSDPARFYTMPAFGAVLSDAQIMEILAYIKTMWTDEQRDNQRRLTEEENRLFSQSGQG